MLDLIDIRRTLHRIPERGFEEAQTSDTLAEVIAALTSDRPDVECRRHRTAIIVHVPGREPTKTIGWRADMDGLPTSEQTGLPFASTNPGLMHACGHDVHMACGLGILEQILAQPRQQSYVFLFQPAEEGGTGARAVVDSGLLDPYGVDEFYALHVSPEWDPGVIATRPGTQNAGASEVTVEFTGAPGHAGMPHLAADPIVAAADFVLQIQRMVARNFDPAAGGVALTLGGINGGTAQDAVACTARVAGTLRVLSKDQQDLAFRRIREIASAVAQSSGTTVDVTLNDGSELAVVDDQAIAKRFADYMSSRDDVRFAVAPVTMTSEDFGYLTSRIPGLMFWLGVGGDDPLHSDRFSPDESAIAPTVALMGEYLTQL